MRIESHQEAFATHRRAIFRWGLEVEGIENAQRIVGLHATRGIVELLSVLLHKKKLIDEGFQLNHRWSKSENVAEKLPVFEKKAEVVGLMVKLEILCETLAYGSPKPISKTEEAITLFHSMEQLLEGLL